MAQRLKNVHPGEVLLEEFLKPLNISQNKLARDLNVPPRRINEICLERRSLSVDTTLRLGRYFKTGPEFWLNLQNLYDMEEKVRGKRDIYNKIKPYQKSVRVTSRKKAS